ncbi:MAG: anhydro-N-acetylmuramic acid kinase [Alphaproteobacteria bacterium]
MKRKDIYVLGIMSGTSLDGLDFSLIKTDAKQNIAFVHEKYFKFDPKLRKEIKQTISFFQNNNFNIACKSNLYQSFNLKFSEHLLKKINFFLDLFSFKKSNLNILGLHGNTLIHNPKKGISLQLGDAKFLSKKIGKPVVVNFRNKDISMGGQGAPLVPIFHKAIFSKKKKNIMIVNIGGISNFTFLIGKKKMVASDIGPGNSLIDKFCKKKFNKNYDNHGFLAAKGEIRNKIVNKWIKSSSFKRRFPKSFDIMEFNIDDYIISDKTSDFDNLRSITYLSAKLISNLEHNFNNKIDQWIFSGGGVYNKTLISDLRKMLKQKDFFLSDELGFNSLFIESAAFAYISARTFFNLPSAFPETTGCKKKNVCGDIIMP